MSKWSSHLSLFWREEALITTRPSHLSIQMTSRPILSKQTRHENSHLYLNITKDLESHQAVFDQNYQNLSSYNLAINLHKFIFACEKLNHLGFKVSADGYSATEEKIKATVEYSSENI